MEAALLQYLLQKGCQTVTQVCEFLRTVGGDVADDRIEQLRLRINRELDFADIEIRRMTSPVTHVASRHAYHLRRRLQFDGNAYVALVNKQKDDIVTETLAKKHPSPRPEFFKRLVRDSPRPDVAVMKGVAASDDGHVAKWSRGRKWWLSF